MTSAQSVSESQMYKYLTDHVPQLFSKVITKAGKTVTLTSWMSGTRAFWHVYSNGGICRVCVLFGKSDDHSKHGAFEICFPKA